MHFYIFRDYIKINVVTTAASNYVKIIYHTPPQSEPVYLLAIKINLSFNTALGALELDL